MAGNQKRFFTEGKIKGEIWMSVDLKMIHKMRNVLRLQNGDLVQIFDEVGKEWEVEISDLGSKKVQGNVLREIKGKDEKGCEVILWQGIPKKDEKLELVCEKVTELGVTGIGFLRTENGLKKEVKKMERIKKIVIEASEQSGRKTVPEILGVGDFEEVLKMEGEKVMLDERGEIRLGEDLGGFEKIQLMVGSEGGFSKEEIEMGKKMGAKICKMGGLILRTETAGIVSVGILKILTCQKK